MAAASAFGGERHALVAQQADALASEARDSGSNPDEGTNFEVKMTKEEGDSKIGEILSEIEPKLQEIFKVMAESGCRPFHYSAVTTEEKVGDAFFELEPIR